MKVVRCLLLFCIYSHTVLVQKSKKGSIGFFKLEKKPEPIIALKAWKQLVFAPKSIV